MNVNPEKQHTHSVFHYASVDALQAETKALDAFLPLSADPSSLLTPLRMPDRQIPNRIVFQPMEGTDGEADGTPGELTERRYRRFAEGGPGVIWFEAVATLPEARASAHQLWLTEQNLGSFQRITDMIREACLRRNGYTPLIIMQATNSGRYAKPHGAPEPLVAYSCPPLEDTPLPESRIVTDEQLQRFEAAYQTTAALCQRAGFDGMDIKACHRYLASELLSAFSRPGPYGGSFENRTRFLKNCYRAALSGVSGKSFSLTSRLNIYDGFPRPWGFGMAEDGSLLSDPTEPIRLLRELREEFHIPLINLTMGNPYKNPHVNRPYDHGNYVPDEHPLVGLGRMMQGVAHIQRSIPELPVIGSAFSYLRQFSVQLAAGMIDGGNCAMAGFGRMAFAYPSFIRDLKVTAKIDPKRCCVTCGGCAALLRAGKPAGCIVRDREVYRL